MPSFLSSNQPRVLHIDVCSFVEGEESREDRKEDEDGGTKA